MSFVDAALKLQAHGFHVFPLLPNGKESLIPEYPEVASHTDKVGMWWKCPLLGVETPYNVGISTTKFGEDEYLLVIDVDNKNGKNGSQEILKLEMQGFILPETFETATPTGGFHYVYRTKSLVGNTRGRIASGVDTRGKGGIAVGHGSIVDAGIYISNFAPVAQAPQWAVDLCRYEEREALNVNLEDIDTEYAEKRAIELLIQAPPAIEFEGANHTTFVLACKLKDLGVPSMSALELMDDHWNARNEKPWAMSQLARFVENAYRYGKSEAGSAAPETAFDNDSLPPLPEPEPEIKEHPFIELNKEFAFVLAGGGHHILRETHDAEGLDKIEHLQEASFHRFLASKKMLTADGKLEPITKLWMGSKERRSYDGFVFRPGLTTPSRYYNLFRGWSVEPTTGNPSQRAQEGLDAFLEHVKENLCLGDENLTQWLLGYFAHMFQKPWEKPLVALVFKGRKGVGKSTVLERIGTLLRQHFMSTSDDRYLMSNFNGHLERLLMFVLEEATWGGNKKADSTLKNLITGQFLEIEHKGQESYRVENRCRVVLIGNEDWLVPASEDERRYAVFNVGEAKMDNQNFFIKMREDLEAGGYSLLLKYFLEFDLTGVNVNRAPKTEGLLEQKMQSLGSIAQWWQECLQEGWLIGSELNEGEWLDQVSKATLQDSYRRYIQSRNIKGWIAGERIFVKKMRMMTSIDNQVRKREGDTTQGCYRLLPLNQARQRYAEFLGHPEMSWD